MGDVLSQVRDLKGLALLARDAGDLDDALAIMSEAEQLLERELAQIHGQSDDSDVGRHEIDVKKQLYGIRGSIGGIHRRAGDLQKSVLAYDRGYEVERDYSDSYNLTQRLVSRVMADPSALEDQGRLVEGIALRSELAEARKAIERQKREDEYAAADLMVIALLLGDSDWQPLVDRFKGLAPRSSYAHQVTIELLSELTRHLEQKRADPSLLERLARATVELTQAEAGSGL